ncbi:MAG: CNNM domain-containing protein, partial [Actinomycetota bacterium]|nr:CNNM domain-containing protein [Actinomycetota bacterium]
MSGLALGALVVLVGVNALFVATEFALVAARPGRLEEAADGGSRLAARGLRAQSALRLHMSCDQLGITASSIAVGILAEPALGQYLAWPLEATGMSDGAV